MALKLYRRHRTECEGGHPEDARSGEFEEGRRGWKKCACLIHVSGTLGGKFNRKQTGKSEWDEAKTLVAAWQKAQSWEGEAAPLPQPDLPPGPARMTIVAAAGAYLSHREGAKIAHATLRKYKTFIEQSTDFGLCVNRCPSFLICWFRRRSGETRTSKPRIVVLSIAPALYVPVRREMERGALSVSEYSAALGRGFSRHEGLPIRCEFWVERER